MTEAATVNDMASGVKAVPALSTTLAIPLLMEVMTLVDALVNEPMTSGRAKFKAGMSVVSIRSPVALK